MPEVPKVTANDLIFCQAGAPMARETDYKPIVDGEQSYEPAVSLIIAAFRGLDAIGVNHDEALIIVKKGLRALGVEVEGPTA